MLAAIVGRSEEVGALETILADLEKEFGFQRYLVFYHDRERNLVSVLESRGFEKKIARQVSFLRTATNEAITPRVAQTGKY